MKFYKTHPCHDAMDDRKLCLHVEKGVERVFIWRQVNGHELITIEKNGEKKEYWNENCSIEVVSELFNKIH